MKRLSMKPVLVPYRRVNLTLEGYQKLRLLKREKKKSMSQIVDDLIEEEYQKERPLSIIYLSKEEKV